VHTGANAVAVTGGYFNVILGNITTLYPNYFSNEGDLWLEVVATINSGTETFSRTRLVSVPSAMTLVPGASIVRDATAANFYVANGYPGWLTIMWRRAIWGQTSDGIAVQGDAGSGTGVLGLAGTGTAVYGSSDSGLGVHGISNTNDGVTGETSQDYKSGVYGVTSATNGYGVTGRSPDYFGVFAWGGGDGSAYDDISDVLLEGTRGEIQNFGTFFNLYSNGNFNLDLDNNDDDANAFFYIWNGTDNVVFSVSESGNMTATGTKSAVVETKSGGERLMYAMESPEVWFEDVGSAQLTGGVAVVSVDALFGETVNLKDYRVFVTPVNGWAPLYVANKTASSFEVRDAGGTSNIAFDYRIVAKRKGYESTRLAAWQPNAQQ
jgi:hypothetical protein